MTNATHKAIGVLTSGGDAPGMNAALRAVIRTALSYGVGIYAIYEGYQGMVEGGNRIRALNWDDAGGIMQRGGTVIGTARRLRESQAELLSQIPGVWVSLGSRSTHRRLNRLGERVAAFDDAHHSAALDQRADQRRAGQGVAE